MKSSKRITALIVAVMFVLTSMVSFNVFADTTDSGFTDLDATNPYYEAITSLVADGVINGYAEADGSYTFKPDNTITRAEFSKLLAVASAPDNFVFATTTSKFPDAAEAEWAIPYIEYAVGTGAINGYEDGSFRPQNPVTYAEAVKMIVCTLGYGNVADKTLTPWYQGYIDIANQIGLTKRAGGLADANAARGLVAQLIYNMGTCNVYNGTTGADGNEIIITGGDTSGGGGGSTLKNSDTGILYGVFEFCLTDTALTKQEVLIDDEIYKLGDLNYEDVKELVGYSVKFSITGDRKKELTKISKESGENDKIVVEDWQIATLNGDEMEYYADKDAYDDDETSTIKFDSDLYVIYNGFVVPEDDIDDEFIEEYLDVTTGSVTFVSNDGNVKNAELAIVESYDLYHVKSVSTVNGVTKFYDTNASALGITEGIEIDEDDAVDAEGEANVTKISSKGGSATKSTLTGISKNSTVAVAVPYDTKEGTKVIISAVSFSGTIKEISEDEYIKVGTEKYEFSPYFEAIRDAGVDVELENGDTAKFYLDPFGRISYFEKSESSNPYGLIIAYAAGSGVDSIPQVRLLNTSSKIITYPLKDKVKINGNSVDADEAIDILKESSPIYTDEMEDKGSKNIVQPVKYVTSTQNGKTVFSEFEIIDMDNPSDGNIVPYPIKNSVNSDEAEFANGGKLKYSKSGYAFKNGNATQFTMNASTVLFVVPSDLNNESSYRKSSATGYFTDTASYCVEPYDVESGTTAKLVVYYSESKNTTVTVSGGTPVAFVEKVSDSTKDGQEGKKLVYYNPGSYESKEAFAPSDSDVIDVLETLEPGDVIKFAQDNGEIVQVKKVYFDEELLTECGKTKDGFANYITAVYDGTEDYFQVILGTVNTLEDGNKITVVPMFVDDAEFDSKTMYSFNWNDSTSFFDFDEKEKEFIQTSDGALRSYEDAKEDASKVLIIITNKTKVAAIYDLGE